MSDSSAHFATLGFLHDPRIAVDRIHVQTNGSLDEAPRLRLSGPHLSPREWIAAEEIGDREAERASDLDRLRDHYTDALALADGEADACNVLLDAVRTFLRLPEPEPITWASAFDALRAEGIGGPGVGLTSTGGGCNAIEFPLPGRLYALLTTTDGTLHADRERENPASRWVMGVYDADGDTNDLAMHEIPATLDPRDDRAMARAVRKILRASFGS